MKFGLIYELQMAKPWHARSEYETYHNALKQIELADDVGFDAVWEVEHHFLSEYSHSSAPECFLAAASQRTKHVRLGQGVALLPYNFNHPIRVAERIAALDILSDGRIDCGTGRSITEAELGGFNIEPADSKPMWEEAVEMLPKMWTQEIFEHRGKYFTVPPRAVIPKPIQQPHPPLWVAATQPSTFVAAGERGLGALCFGFNAPTSGVLEDNIAKYRQALRACTRPVGQFINDQLAASAIAVCAESRAAAMAAAEEAAMFFLVQALQLFSPWYGKDVKGYEYYTEMASKGGSALRVGEQQSFAEMVESGTFVVGTPDDCVRAVEKYERVGVDQMLLLVQAGRIPHETTMESIRLFGKHIIPEFRRRAADTAGRRAMQGGIHG